MNITRFDLIFQKLTNNWDFEDALDLFRSNAINNSKQLEFCVYLADIGLLDELHKFITHNGLYNLMVLADDPDNKYEKRENAKRVLNIYESEMLTVFECRSNSLLGIDGKLLSLSQYADTSILENYVVKNKEAIFRAEQTPKTLMYLAYAINKIIRAQPGDVFLLLLLDNIDIFKNINSLRKAYIIRNISLILLLRKEIITFPKNSGYNKLQTLLAIVATQKRTYSGAARLYAMISEAVRLELKEPILTHNSDRNRNPKIAVCISGMYRCGNTAIESVYSNIIEPLGADVFFHSWNEMEEWPGLGGAGDQWLQRIFSGEIIEKCPTFLRSKKYFRENFPRTYNLVNSPRYVAFDGSKLPKNINFTKIELEDAAIAFQKFAINEENFLSAGNLNQAKMLYGIFKAHELATDYEREKGFRYDYIIRCRPDVVLFNKLCFSELENLQANEVAMDFAKEYGPQDQFWYGQRSAALSMASLWDASVSSNRLSPFADYPLMRAHGLLLAWMVHKNLHPAYTPVRRNIAMLTSKSALPDFSAALAEDFANEAHKLRENHEVLKFFSVLLGWNK